MPIPFINEMEKLVVKDEQPIVHPKIEFMFQEEFEQLPESLKSDYMFDKETRTYKLPEYIWRQWRKHGPYYKDAADPRYIEVAIGGSDIAVLYEGSELSNWLYRYEGQHGSTYKIPVELWMEKTGRELPMKEPSKADIFFIGHNEEPSIRNLFKHWYEKDHPLDVCNVINDTHMYQCGRKDANGKLLLPFCLCNLDGVVVINGIKVGLECKTCQKGSEDYKLWKKGIVPLKYYLQICWYMLGTNLPGFYICCKWGMGVNDFTYIFIERDFEVENELIKMAEEFVRCVKEDVEPSMDGNNIERLYVFWRKRQGPYVKDVPPVELSEKYMDSLVELSIIQQDIEKANQTIKNLKEHRGKILTNVIFPLIGKANKCFIPSGKKAIVCETKYNPIRKANCLDIDRLKQERPSMFEKYVHREEVFDGKLFVKEQPTVAEEYLINNLLTETRKDYCKVRMEQIEKLEEEINECNRPCV